MNRAQAEKDFHAEFAFHRREWLVQRIGWVVIALLLSLALAGLFGGGGPLSDARTSSKEAGLVEYERYTRREAPTTLTITPAAGVLRRETVRVAIAYRYLQAFRIERITPEPLRVQANGDQLIFEFAAGAPGSPVIYRLEPVAIGAHRTRIRIGEAAPLAIRQLTYP